MIPVSRIVIHRHLAAGQDTLRSYRILVDGHSVAKVTNGQTIAVDVAAGVHHLQARINWSGSPITQVEAPADDRYTSTCDPPAHRLTRAGACSLGTSCLSCESTNHPSASFSRNQRADLRHDPDVLIAD